MFTVARAVNNGRMSIPSSGAASPIRQAVPWIITAVIVIGLAAWLIVRSVGPPKEDIPDTLGGYGALCNVEPSIFPDAPAYAAAGPRPAVVLVTSQVDYWAAEWRLASDLPSSALTGPWTETDPAKVQVVACVVRDRDAPDHTLEKCAYWGAKPNLSNPGPELSIIEGEYDLTLKSARDGRVLHRVHITGTDKTCPEQVPVTTSEIFTVPTDAQLRDAIGSFVEG